MADLKLFKLLLGCKPEGRFTEQHDIFFGIAGSLKELIPHIKGAWPEAKGKIHIDAWREVNHVDEFRITVKQRSEQAVAEEPVNRLFFINLGGYKPGEFDEFHYKMLVAATNSSEAIKASKRTAFFKHTGFKGAPSHIDDKYGVDVDDVYNVAEILPAVFKDQYELELIPQQEASEPDVIHLGYLPLGKADKL